MPSSTAVHGTRPKKSAKRAQRFRASRLWPSAQSRRRSWRAFLRAPTPVKVVVSVAVALVLAVAINWVYQVLRKPSELLFPVSGALFKTPTETWERYAPLFSEYSTSVMTPDLLAAIAQVEGSGNPMVRTYWRWSWKLHPFEIYRPASSAVGMYQITDGTFAEAKHYCIHEHAVATEGSWHSGRSCWFNGLYSRIVPANAVELTSAYLDSNVSAILARHGISGASLRRKQDLAAMIHLCGAGAGDAFARRGFKLSPGQRCGDHEVRGYLARVSGMKAVFDRIALRAS
jgi:Transglycosylase SLT domain